MQKITGTYNSRPTNYNNGSLVISPGGAFYLTSSAEGQDVIPQNNVLGTCQQVNFDSSRVTRADYDVTHGKQKGVKFIIKVL